MKDLIAGVFTLFIVGGSFCFALALVSWFFSFAEKRCPKIAKFLYRFCGLSAKEIDEIF
ncbi:MAG: hypothetical protein IJY30_02310 [Muribaculaceae bacterium]|nr:hypothetical protein [Muribaculaceae bacterium]